MQRREKDISYHFNISNNVTPIMLSVRYQNYYSSPLPNYFRSERSSHLKIRISWDFFYSSSTVSYYSQNKHERCPSSVLNHNTLYSFIFPTLSSNLLFHIVSISVFLYLFFEISFCRWTPFNLHFFVSNTMWFVALYFYFIDTFIVLLYLCIANIYFYSLI